MLKIFFIIFFLAELIIAFAVVLKLYQFDKCVNNLNKLVLLNQNKIDSWLEDFGILLRTFTKNLLEIKLVLIRKRDEYMLNFLKTSFIYSALFLLKGKYKKSVLTFQLVKEIYEGITEA